jgi:Tfp pilus assembly protein PilV
MFDVGRSTRFRIRGLARPARQEGAGRSAFSLLEVVLALAILTGGLTACLGLIDLGIRSAREARDQTRAQEICESVLGLITSGVVDVNSVQGERQAVADIWAAAGLGYGLLGDLELQAEEDYWRCSIISEPSDVNDVLKVTVTVTENSLSSTPIQFTMVRWLQDPAYLEQLTEMNQQMSQPMSQPMSTTGGQ